MGAPQPTTDVVVLQWPADERLRQQVARLGSPRLLLVEHADAPPVLLDDLEDWLRTPFAPDDLAARRDELLRRAARSQPAPEVDADGLLRVGPAWVALTPAQAPVVRLLVANLDRVVRHEQVAAVYEVAGGSVRASSVQTMLKRIGRRAREVGLDLVTVRRRGVLLTASGPAR